MKKGAWKGEAFHAPERIGPWGGDAARAAVELLAGAARPITHYFFGAAFLAGFLAAAFFGAAFFTGFLAAAFFFGAAFFAAGFFAAAFFGAAFFGAAFFACAIDLGPPFPLWLTFATDFVVQPLTQLYTLFSEMKSRTEKILTSRVLGITRCDSCDILRHPEEVIDGRHEEQHRTSDAGVAGSLHQSRAELASLRASRARARA
jgi:hypothetical protein